MKEFFAALGISTILIITGVLAVCCCCCCFLILGMASYTPNSGIVVNTGNVVPGNGSTPSANNNNFQGDYISAELPAGWKLVEYNDGSNVPVDLQFEGSFSKFTGMELKSPAGNTVINMYMADGVGGTAFCPKVYVMTDTATSYVNSMMAIDQGVVGGGSQKPEKVTVPGPYYDFSFLNNAGRISQAGDAYWKEADSTPASAFNPRCRVTKDILKISGLTYQISAPSGQTENNTYLVDINAKNLTTAEKQQLVKIINSLEII